MTPTRLWALLLAFTMVLLISAGSLFAGLDALIKVSGTPVPVLVPLNAEICGPEGSNVSVAARPAMFGPQLPLEPNVTSLSGPVKVVNGMACSHIEEGSDLMGHVAVVLRGGCEFYEKVLSLQTRGAIAVVVGDNVRGRGLVTMFTQDSVDRARVPSFFVTRESYEMLSKLDSVTIRGGTEGSTVADTLIFLLVSPLCSLSIIYGMLLFHRRYKMMKERAPKSVVDKFPTRMWGEDTSGLADTKHWVSGNECIVCLEEFIPGLSKVMRLPCGHEFHVNCIRRWLVCRKKTCPICKQDVTRVCETTPLIKRWRRNQNRNSASSTMDRDLEQQTPLLEPFHDRDTDNDPVLDDSNPSDNAEHLAEDSAGPIVNIDDNAPTEGPSNNRGPPDNETTSQSS